MQQRDNVMQNKEGNQTRIVERQPIAGRVSAAGPSDGPRRKQIWRRCPGKNEVGTKSGWGAGVGQGLDESICQPCLICVY